MHKFMHTSHYSMWQDNTACIELIEFDVHGREKTSLVTEDERTQLHFVDSSMAWIAWQCRPDQAFYPSRIQSVVNGAEVQHKHNLGKAEAEDDQNISKLQPQHKHHAGGSTGST